jgi:hypothetical protein
MVSRVQAFKKLLRQTARELGESRNSGIVRHVAMLKLAEENALIRMLNGEKVDPAEAVKLHEAIRQFLPQGKPITVNVEFVNGDEPFDPPPSPAPTPPTSPTETKPSAPSVPAANVVQLRPVGSIHDMVMPSGEVPPLKRYQNAPWRGHVGPVGGDPYGTASNPFSAGPMPNFSAPYRGR